jgi:hypothetical protein
MTERPFEAGQDEREALLRDYSQKGFNDKCGTLVLRVHCDWYDEWLEKARKSQRL